MLKLARFGSSQGWLLWALLMLCYCTAAGSAAAQAAESTLKKVLDRGYLIAGVRSTTPGFGFKNDQGELDGFDIDLSKEIAKGLFNDPTKLKFQVLPIGAERVPALVSDRVDAVISQFSVFVERAQVAGFTLPYCNADFAALVRKDSPYQKNADLNGKVVTTRQGSELDKLILDAIPKAQIQSYPSLSDAFTAFQQGRAEAFFDDHAAELFITLKFPGQYRVIVDKENALDTNQYSIGVRQDDIVWLNYLNWSLNRMALTGVLRELHMKWLKTDELMPFWTTHAY